MSSIVPANKPVAKFCNSKVTISAKQLQAFWNRKIKKAEACPIPDIHKQIPILNSRDLSDDKQLSQKN